VTAVLRPGYRIGERLLRPAMVAVTDRDPGAPDLPTGPADDGVAEAAPRPGAEHEHEHD